jgi:hypothetical protein
MSEGIDQEKLAGILGSEVVGTAKFDTLTNTVAVQPTESKRKTLTMGDRTKVIDYLRSRVEPVTADSNQAIASMVSEASKVDINWTQLKYMIEDESMAEWKLGEKIHLKVTVSSGDELMNSLEARVSELESLVSGINTILMELTKRVANPNQLL